MEERFRGWERKRKNVWCHQSLEAGEIMVRLRLWSGCGQVMVDDRDRYRHAVPMETRNGQSCLSCLKRPERAVKWYTYTHTHTDSLKHSHTQTHTQTPTQSHTYTQDCVEISNS